MSQLKSGRIYLLGIILLASSATKIDSRVEVGVEDPEGGAPMEIVDSNNQFGFDLQARLVDRNPNGSLVFSPFSVYLTLAMAIEGARGETAEEMGQAMRFPGNARRADGDAQGLPWTTEPIHSCLAEIRNGLSSADDNQTFAIRAEIESLRKRLESVQGRIRVLEADGKWDELIDIEAEERRLVTEFNRRTAQVDLYEIRIANALWGEETYPFLRAFEEKIAQYYGTETIVQVDFRTQGESARQRINRWVEEQTHMRIRELVPANSLSERTCLVLTNAIYFRGEWAEPFPIDRTEERTFTLGNGEVVKAVMMHGRFSDTGRYAAFYADGSPFETPTWIERGQETGLYPEAGGFAMLELPYKGGRLSLVAIAPNDPQGLPAVESQVGAQTVRVWMDRLAQREVEVLLPRFKLESESTLGDSEEEGPLQALGIVRAFVNPNTEPANGADFSGMTSSLDPDQRLFVSKVIHKAMIEVNEVGTEAAAATAMMMKDALAETIEVPFIPVFRADRPFLFLIRDRLSGTILFMGRVLRP